MMDTRILTTFPTEGQPSPHITANLRNFPVRPPPGKPITPSAAQQLNRWFCCKCAERGYQDPVGMVNNSDSAPPPPTTTFQRTSSSTTPTTAAAVNMAEPCWQPACSHIKCINCLASPNYNVQDAIRTFGGLHTSPRFVDPVFWECPCGEWALNPFSEAQTTMGMTLCNSQSCDFRYRGGQQGTLQPDSVVMNCYGQRLGTADQRVALMGGPWHWQRRGLGDAGCVLIGAFRMGGQGRGRLPGMAAKAVGAGARDSTQGQGQRTLPPMMPSLPTSPVIVWPENESVPRYPYRPPPPSTAGAPKEARSGESGTTRGTPNKAHPCVVDDTDPQEIAYRVAYLAGIPSELRAVDRDIGRRPGMVESGNANTNWPTAPPVSGPVRSHLHTPSIHPSRFAGSVGVADHVRIQMDMQMQVPAQPAQSQVSKGYFPGWA